MNRADPSPSGSYQSINQSVHRQVIKRITAPLHRDASRKQLSLAPTPIPSLPAHQNSAFPLDLEFSRHSGTLLSIPSDGSIDIPPGRHDPSEVIHPKATERINTILSLLPSHPFASHRVTQHLPIKNTPTHIFCTSVQNNNYGPRNPTPPTTAHPPSRPLQQQ